MNRANQLLFWIVALPLVLLVTVALDPWLLLLWAIVLPVTLLWQSKRSAAKSGEGR